MKLRKGRLEGKIRREGWKGRLRGKAGREGWKGRLEGKIRREGWKGRLEVKVAWKVGRRLKEAGERLGEAGGGWGRMEEALLIFQWFFKAGRWKILIFHWFLCVFIGFWGKGGGRQTT